MNGNTISKMILSGRTASPEAMRDVSDLAKCAKLGDAVKGKLAILGYKDAETAAMQAIAGYADVLTAGKWKGINTVADRVVARYTKVHSPSSGPQGGADVPEGEGDPETTGPGDGEGPDSGSPDGQQERSAEDGPQGQIQGQGSDDGEAEDGGSAGGSEGEEQDDEDGPGSGTDGEDQEGDQDGQNDQGDEDQDGDCQAPEQEQEQEDDDTVPPEPEPQSSYEFDDDWIPPKDFDLIVEAVRMGKNVALYGPAGCGKTDIMIHVGQAVGVPYYITTAPQMPYDLTGFVDAQGRYVETAFSVPFVNGGIAGIDEMDRAGPEAVIAVNAPIANGTMFVPNKGQMRKHPDCIFMATLNTAGLGADLEYVTANQLDASTRDRFVWFHIDYDERVDSAIAKGDARLVIFAQDWREACRKAGVTNALFSYRVLKDFKELCTHPKFGVRQAIDKTLLKGGVPKSTCMTIMQYMSHNNIYHQAFRDFVDDMQEVY